MVKTYEKVKYIVTRNIIIFLCVSMAILVIVNLFTAGHNLKIASVALSLACLVLIFLIKSKSYRIASVIAISLGYGVNLANLFRASNFESFVDLFWLINLSIFAYFTLGKVAGHLYLFLNISSLFVISVLSQLEYIILYPASKIYNLSSFIDFGINFGICAIFFGYLITEFIKQTNKANYDSIQSNIELQKQFDEKSIMLKEIHHRVKNNLQVITSLLRLQLYKIDNEEVAAPFNESIDRIYGFNSRKNVPR